jgi:hypothetical protein
VSKGDLFIISVMVALLALVGLWKGAEEVFKIVVGGSLGAVLAIGLVWVANKIDVG